MRISLVDGLVFVAEVAVYVAVGWAAWVWLPQLAPAAMAAGGAVLAMAVWWGLLHSPKAPIHLPRLTDAALRVTWFSVGLLAAVAAAAGRSAGAH